MKKLRIGVLMGGKSLEREVSLNSGRTICDHLDAFVYDIQPLFQTHDGRLYRLPWSFLHRGKTTDFAHRLSAETQEIAWDNLSTLIDFLYIAMHGRFAEDGCLQGMLEVLGIPYLGSGVFASALCMDKEMQKQTLIQKGISVPAHLLVRSHEIANIGTHKKKILKQLEERGIDFPCVVKPRHEGSSIGVAVVQSPYELFEAVTRACTVHPDYDQDVVVEKKLTGMEFSQILLAQADGHSLHALPPTEIVYQEGALFWDYNQKYMPGRSLKFTPARCSQENHSRISQICLQVAAALEIKTIARIDGFLTNEGEVFIIDPNTFCGSAPSSFLFKQAAEIGFSHTQLINHLIKTDLQVRSMQLTNVDPKLKFEEKKVRVAVLFGGTSNEREISLESGRNVVYKLSPHKYEAIPIFVASNGRFYKLSQRLLVCNATSEIEHVLHEADPVRVQDLPLIADFVFIALHGGQGENGCVQGMLEMLGLPYNGSSMLASGLCIDKYKTTEFLSGRGFAVPRSTVVAKEDWIENKANCLKKIERSCGLPLIIKPIDDGCSFGVQVIKEQGELEKAIENLFACDKSIILVQEYIGGMELTVGIVGNHELQVFPPTQVKAAAGVLSIEEKFLPGQGENLTPAPLNSDVTARVQQTVKDVYQALDCAGYARIDCFYQTADESPTGAERVVVLEINTLPGLTPATCIFHQAAEIGLKPMEFIDLIISLGLQRHRPSRVFCPSESKELSQLSFE